MKDKNLHNKIAHGFKAPKGYFESFDENLMDKLNSPLTSIDNSGFNVPKDYFETLEDVVLNNLPKEETSKVIPLFSKRNLIYVSSVAAAILLLFNLSIFDNNGDGYPTFSSLDDETIENYVINENISSDEIASLLTDEELSDENFIDYNFEDEAVENYILNNLEAEDLFIE